MEAALGMQPFLLNGHYMPAEAWLYDDVAINSN